MVVLSKILFEIVVISTYGVWGYIYMAQQKRLSGKKGMGYFTEWSKSVSHGCVYCGQSATTREHIPSKAFLIKPYPENLPTIPACFDCNNGFSDDEKYVSCFLDVLKEYMYQNYTCQAITTSRLERDHSLAKLMKEQIKIVDGCVQYSVDEARLRRILVKLAKGHAAFAFDEVVFDCENIKVKCIFRFDMPDDVLCAFEEIPEINVFPELGSRSWYFVNVVQDIRTGCKAMFSFWQEIQEGQYRYQVSFNESGGVRVKIVIFEFLYCLIDFPDCY